MTRLALAMLLAFAVIYALALMLLRGTAWAGDTAGAALWEPQGRPVVVIQDVLRTVRPGDDMAAVLAVYAEPEGGWCTPWNPCCPGCGLDGETTPPQPAQVPLPPTLLLLTAAIAALALKGKRYA